MVSTVDILFRYLPLRISKAVHSLPKEYFMKVNEIRLRVNSPISATCGTDNIIFDENGNICGISSAICATENEIRECISKLTNNSLYTCDSFIEKGFIPLAEGGRAGVCGRSNGNGFAEITSVNLRLHRFLPYAARDLIEEFANTEICGTLVCSPPALGKTTFLRSAAYMLSAGQGIKPIRVGIADERAEIAAGMPRGGLLDVISGVPKWEGISLLTRTMSPQVIICDEISADETESVLEAQNTGVCLLASAHCKTPKDLLKRGRMKNLLESGVFPLCALLDYDGEYLCRISKTEDFL